MTERVPVTQPSLVSPELGPRILSGLLMGGLALAANWASPLLFTLLVGCVGLVLSWEWSRIVRGNPLDAAFLVQGAVVVAAVGLSAMGRATTASAIVLAGAALSFLAARSRQPALSGLGALYVGLPAIALVWLRTDIAYGMHAILFIYAVVWATDTFAYVCGRLIGGPKLWPRISPNKTWSGTLGGLGCAALSGLVFGLWIGHATPAALALAAGMLSAAAQIGDLAESSLKRAFGIKHASHLIPGHGGFMDRMDGIVAAAVVAAAIALAVNPLAPARALLFWS